MLSVLKPSISKYQSGSPVTFPRCWYWCMPSGIMILYLLFIILIDRILSPLPSTVINRSNTLSSYLVRVGIHPRPKNRPFTSDKKGKPAYNDVESPLFITMADSFYLPAVRNFEYALRKYRLEKNFIVICLDNPCVKLGRSQGLFVCSAFVHASVAEIKFETDLDLSQAGFDFILFDSDVYLSQSQNPLSFMIDIVNNSWDIQFQSDQNDPKGSVNIGWFWSRPSPQTIHYFEKSRKRWLARGGWDQAVMNEILSEIESSSSISSESRTLIATRLDRDRYMNFMLTSWYKNLSPTADDPNNFFALPEDVRHQRLHNASEKSVIWHYTCVEKSLKAYFAKYFGQWTDFDGYYTTKRQFLSPTNLGHGAKKPQVMLNEFLIAAKLALISERTLIFPDSVLRNGKLVFPAVRAISIADIEMANISYVEPTFLYNRKTKHDVNPSTQSVCNFSLAGTENVAGLTERLIYELDSTLKEAEVVFLDFGQFNAWNDILSFSNFDVWWANLKIANDKGQKNLNSIRLCPNMAKDNVDCLKIC